MVHTALVIKQYLNTSGTALKTSIGSNLFWERVNNFDGSTSKGLMYRIRAGATDIDVPIHDLQVDFFCYGGSDTFDASYSIYRQLHDVLHGKTSMKVNDGFIISASEIVKGQNLVDPDTKWLFTLTTYSITLRNN